MKGFRGAVKEEKTHGSFLTSFYCIQSTNRSRVGGRLVDELSILFYLPCSPLYINIDAARPICSLALITECSLRPGHPSPPPASKTSFEKHKHSLADCWLAAGWTES